jgi:hypothetical protein
MRRVRRHVSSSPYRSPRPRLPTSSQSYATCPLLAAVRIRRRPYQRKVPGTPCTRDESQFLMSVTINTAMQRALLHRGQTE